MITVIAIELFDTVTYVALGALLKSLNYSAV